MTVFWGRHAGARGQRCPRALAPHWTTGPERAETRVARDADAAEVRRDATRVVSERASTRDRQTDRERERERELSSEISDMSR